MNPIRTTAGLSPVTGTSTAILNGVRKLQLINEALSRARMRWPDWAERGGGTRPARAIAMQARRRAARDLSAW